MSRGSTSESYSCCYCYQSVQWQATGWTADQSLFYIRKLFLLPLSSGTVTGYELDCRSVAVLHQKVVLVTVIIRYSDGLRAGLPISRCSTTESCSCYRYQPVQWRATGWTADQSRLHSQHGKEICLWSIASRPALGSPSLLSNGYQRLLPGGELVGRQTVGAYV
jgi:hypothetical protein